MSIGASLVLIALGAILAFALQLDPTPVAGITVDWGTVGWILALVGVIGLIWSLVLLSHARRNDVIVDDRPVVDDRPPRRIV